MRAAWALLVAICLSCAYLLGEVNANPPGTGSAPATATPGTVLTVNVPDGKCHEDDPCWARHHVVQPDSVPGWVNCNLIHDETLWHICYGNINKHRAVWHYVGNYDGHRQVWAIPGPTTVYVNRQHWAESS